MKNDDMIIIGGGLAGISAGIYALRNGFSTTIFESSGKPGGVCAYWIRGSYPMSTGIRMLIGSAPQNPFYTLLKEVGIIDGVKINPMEEFHCVEDETGERVVIYKEPAKLFDSFLRVSPQDREEIERFLDILDHFSRFKPPVEVNPDAAGILDGIESFSKLFPVAKYFALYRKTSVLKYLERFKSAILKRTFLKLYSIPEFSVLAMFCSIGWFVGGQVGYPEGGPRAIVDAILRTYLKFGGKINFNSKVDKIIVERGKAVGVKLVDGSEYRGKVVLSAADGHSTIFHMLDGKFINDSIRNYYFKLPLFTPLVTIHFGIEIDFKEKFPFIHLPLREPFSILGREIKNLNFHIIKGEMNGALAGKSVVRIGIETPYEPWEEIAKTPHRYSEEKMHILREVIRRLDERYPGFASNVKVTDVATPVTFVKYTGNWKGSYEGWLPTIKTFGLRMSKTLPNLENFYMAGQWVEPGGGIPAVIRSARNAIGLVCKNNKKKFIPY